MSLVWVAQLVRDMTLPANYAFPYVVESLSVGTNVTLTIEPGTILKISNPILMWLGSYRHMEHLGMRYTLHLSKMTP